MCPPAVTDDPSRTLLGATQKAWLKGALRASRARWKIVANQVMITPLDARPCNPLNTDSWDGYGAERRELIDHIAAQGITDVTFITGDIHTFLADTGDVLNGPPRATEFVGGAVTSPGIVHRAASGEAERIAVAAVADAAVLGNNPQLTYSNQADKGYALLEAGPAGLRVRYRAVRETRSPTSPVFALRSFGVASGRPVVVDEGGPLPLPEPAPPGPLPPLPAR